VSHTANYAPVTKGLARFEECGRSCPFDHDTIAKLQADARALWAVRVLDRWTRYEGAQTGRWYVVQCCVVVLHAVSRVNPATGSERYFDGPTPDAARIAAAEALVAEDPSLDVS
jgi:hypothetical protein